MTPEDAIEIIRDLLPKQPYVPYRTVTKRNGKGLITEVVPLSVEEEADRSLGLSISGHVLSRGELIEYLAKRRAQYQADFDRIHEAFSMLFEAVKP